MPTKKNGIAKKKMKTVMDEYKHHELKSGKSGKTVTNRKQAIAIGLSESRKAGANVPPAPDGKKKAAKKKAVKKTAPKKAAKKAAKKR